MKILVPLDGSPLAEHALAPATDLARRMRDPVSITLLRVVSYPTVELELDGMGLVASGPTLIDDVLAAAHDYVRAIAQRTYFAGLEVQVQVELGVAATVITATAHQCDLVVMTSHGRTGFAHLALGSVAEAVIREARVPVLLVRAHHETFPDIGRHQALVIVVPLDGSELAESAIAPAAQIALAMHGTIHLLHVLPPEPPNVAQEITAHEAYAYLTLWHDRLVAQGVTVHRCLAFGDVAEQILAKSQEHHADLVAIATHGRTGLARAMKGSIAEAVIQRTPLPALVVHPATPAPHTAHMETTTAS
jgi:nucleotide-binding universal stress UspA family protein